MVAIGFVAWLYTGCSYSDGSPYSFGSGCVDDRDLLNSALILTGAVLIVSLPAWCIAGIIESMRLVRSRLRARPDRLDQASHG